MTFWDSSAIVPLLVEEARSPACRSVLRGDRSVAVWAFTPVEVASALRRHEREGWLDAPDVLAALGRLDRLSRRWTRVTARDVVAERAIRLLAVHALSATDALQLGAAVELVGDRPGGHVFVTADERLADAASRAGFDALVPR